MRHMAATLTIKLKFVHHYQQENNSPPKNVWDSWTDPHTSNRSDSSIKIAWQGLSQTRLWVRKFCLTQMPMTAALIIKVSDQCHLVLNHENFSKASSTCHIYHTIMIESNYSFVSHLNKTVIVYIYIPNSEINIRMLK